MSFLETLLLEIKKAYHFRIGTKDKPHSAFKLFATARNKIIYPLNKVLDVSALRAIYVYTSCSGMEVFKIVSKIEKNENNPLGLESPTWSCFSFLES